MAFGIYFGETVAIAWLRVFLLAIASDLLLISPITILFKSVFLPRLVSSQVFSHPELSSMAATPLMSGTLGVVGPTGQIAVALGIVSAGVAGVVGRGAARWLSRSRTRKTGTSNCSNNNRKKIYVVEQSKRPEFTKVEHSKYVLEDNSISKNRSDVPVGGSRYAVLPRLRSNLHGSEASTQGSIHVDGVELEKAVFVRAKRLHMNMAARRVLALNHEKQVTKEITDERIFKMIIHLLDHHSHHNLLKDYKNRNRTSEKSEQSTDDTFASRKYIKSFDDGGFEESLLNRTTANSITQQSFSHLSFARSDFTGRHPTSHIVQAFGQAMSYEGPIDKTKEATMIEQMRKRAQIENDHSWATILSSEEIKDSSNFRPKKMERGFL